MKRPEFLVFYSLIKSMEYKCIVEIGVEVGDACVMFNEAAKQNNAEYYGYDLWATHGLKQQYVQRGSKESVENRIKKMGSKYKLTQIDTINNFEEFQQILKKDCPSGIDFAFIDACHSYLGIWNDFRAVYPLLNKTGIIAFHDTQKIDGCREFVLDLRTKFYDGTYDIVDFPIGQGQWKAGVTLLVKRSFQALKVPIDEACGSINSVDDIERREEEWYEKEVANAKPEDISIHPTIKEDKMFKKGYKRKWKEKL